MKRQVIVIHGGDSFDTYEEYIDFLRDFEVTIDSFRQRMDWKTFLQDELGSGYDVFFPRMPDKNNAKFSEWKIWFEKMFPFVTDGVILVGHSLGGMFIAKYLAENKFPKKIAALFLVAAPHNNSMDVGDFTLPGSLTGVEKQVPVIHLLYSRDDEVVPFTEYKEYKKQLPDAKFFIFEFRGHFNQAKFHELVDLIKEV
ncbi:MAG: alpha/beta fold hydrolase [Patescibacteria group bacterium]